MTIAPGQPESTDEAVLETIEVVDDHSVAIKGRSPWEIVRARLRRDKVTMVAFVSSIFFVLLAVAVLGNNSEILGVASIAISCLLSCRGSRCA